MDLMLTVIEAPANVNMINQTKAFPVEGGYLGRADDNYWVLPDYDRVVSSRHAHISLREGYYCLTDLSTNGTFHNQQEQAIGAEQSVRLQHGDILSLGDYRLKVSIRNNELSDQLPKGLQPADFLDAEDKTLFTTGPTGAGDQHSRLQQLDAWLDPETASKPRSAAWGTSGFHARITPTLAEVPLQTGAHDPLLMLGAATDGTSTSSHTDPLAALAQAAVIAPTTSSAWDDDDNWWTTCSDNDHAPASTTAMYTPKPVPAAVEYPVADGVASSPAFAGRVAGQSEPVAHSSRWDNQPHLQNVTVTDVDDILGFSPAPASATLQQRNSVWPTPDAQPVAHSAAVDAHMPAAHQSQTPPSAASHQPRPVTAGTTDQSAADVLATALGIDELDPQQLGQLMPEVAAILNETVTRLMDLLRARASIKNELRVERTMIQMLDNNPLKFSVSAQDAIKTLFRGKNPAFMAPVEAVKRSFDDLSDHQVAVLAGMRSGYEFMLKHFDPQSLEHRFSHRPTLLRNKKARNWEAFEQYFQLLKQDSEVSYDRLFGDSFAIAYERQLAELATARNLTRRGK